MIVRSLDSETEMTVPGLQAPPLACVSFAGPDGAGVVPADQAVTKTLEVVESGDLVAGAYICYDVASTVAHAERVGDPRARRLRDAWFQAYAEGRVHDVLLCEKLHAVAEGTLGIDPRDGSKDFYPSLESTVEIVLGRTDAKVNAYWRKRYGILLRVPFHLWPPDAQQYPVDDAINARDVALAQIAGVPRRKHRWVEPGRCAVCDHLADGPVALCAPEPRKNLGVLPDECRAELAMYLSKVHGMRTDGAYVDALEERVRGEREAETPRWQKVGFLRPDGVEDKATIKKLMARAAGAADPCKVCGGTGKVPGAGKNLRNCVVKHGAFVGHPEACDGTGLDLAPTRGKLTFTDNGGISAGRDLLLETGVEDLVDYAEYKEEDKLLSLFVPLLRKGTQVPYNPMYSSLVASGRAAVGGGLHSIPQQGGVREGFVARPGHVLCSSDFAALELSTLAQTCLNWVGFSKMADTINESKNPGALHTLIGSRLAGREIDKKSPFRQAAKAFNFGLPGGMGTPKFVFKKREKKEGVTYTPDAAFDAKGEWIPGTGKRYWGLRFCVLIGGSARCGTTMTSQWSTYEHPPICAACAEQVDMAKRVWFDTFPEVREYLNMVSMLTETGPAEISYGGMVRGGCEYSDGANTSFQGLAARGWKLATWRLAHAMYVEDDSPLFGSRLLLGMHDDNITELPEEVAHEAAHRQAEIMVESMRVYTPDVWVVCEPAIARRLYKQMEAVYVPDASKPGGRRLVTWEPKS